MWEREKEKVDGEEGLRKERKREGRGDKIEKQEREKEGG